jgi:hypothetical protein
MVKMSTIQYALPHHGMTSEYQSSGVPYVITLTVANTTAQLVELPYVARHFTVIHATAGGSSVRVGFTQNGVDAAVTANYFLLEKGSISPRLELKCRKIFVRNDSGTTSNKISIICGLTNVAPSRFFAMTGSEGVAGVG